MEHDLKELTKFFIETGSSDIEHTDKSYLAHAIAVHNDLKRWGADDELCRAGLFHSIYGTELFKLFQYPLENRPKVRELIGERAEQLAYWVCAMRRDEFDKAAFQEEGPYPLHDRFTDDVVMLDDDQFHDMLMLQACDWLEQVARANMWDYRREGIRQMAKRLGGIVWDEYEQVYAQEPTS